MNDERTRPDRVRMAFRRQRRSYWLAVIVLAACVVLLGTMFRPRRRTRPVLPEPTVSAPAFRIIEIRDMPTQGADRLSIVALVSPGLARESLRAVLDWMLYSALAAHNRQGGRSVRVVWAYVLEDTLALKSSWRAMAIWTDPKLPESLRPAGIGGDAVRVGPVEYDFTSNLGILRSDSLESKGEKR